VVDIVLHHNSQNLNEQNISRGLEQAFVVPSWIIFFAKRSHKRYVLLSQERSALHSRFAHLPVQPPIANNFCFFLEENSLLLERTHLLIDGAILWSSQVVRSRHVKGGYSSPLIIWLLTPLISSQQVSNLWVQPIDGTQINLVVRIILEVILALCSESCR